MFLGFRAFNQGSRLLVRLLRVDRGSMGWGGVRVWEDLGRV